MEERLVELETKVAFQEDTLLTLNDIIARQQLEIERLNRAVERITTQLAAAMPQIAAQSEETPPPHY